MQQTGMMNLGNDEDYIGRSLNEALSVFGSLNWDVYSWMTLLDLLKDGESACLKEFAEALCVMVVPVEGSPHPQRAEVDVTDGQNIMLTTPGDVAVMVHYAEDTNDFSLKIDFNRNSTVAALHVLCVLAPRHPNLVPVLRDVINDQA